MFFDPKARGWISQESVIFFLYMLEDPFIVKCPIKGTVFETAILEERK